MYIMWLWSSRISRHQEPRGSDVSTCGAALRGVAAAGGEAPLQLRIRQALAPICRFAKDQGKIEYRL